CMQRVFGSMVSKGSLAHRDQTIIKRDGVPSLGRVPPEPRLPGDAAAAAAPSRQITDPTLSADGVHFSFGHALLIGVGRYATAGLTVPRGTTANDMRVLGEVLVDPLTAAYPAAQVRVLLDAQATRAAILAALDDLAERAVGTVFVAFAGHGVQYGTQFALLPYDADRQDLAATSLDATCVQQALAKVRQRAQRLVVVLNCCHAGGIGDAVLSGDAAALLGAAPPADFYRPLGTGSGQVVISSARPDQQAGAVAASDPQHTPFGLHLLAALRGRAGGSGPAVGVFDLFAYLRATVPAEARHIVTGGHPLVQEPLFYASRLDANLPVALRPAQAAPGTLGAGHEGLAEQLVAIELYLEAAGAAATPAMLARRDELLVALGMVQSTQYPHLKDDPSTASVGEGDV
ncbi:caspase family protein, partial [Candidatus Chloroploca sp. M-50]